MIRFLSIIVFFGTLNASIIVVEPNESIQVAVHTAIQGDTIVICEGNYLESVVTYGKSLTIGSQYLIDGDSLHIDQTIITADLSRIDTSSCFTFCYYPYDIPNQSYLIGLTLSGGGGTYWTVNQNTVGGAVFILESNVQIVKCKIQNSTAAFGGGVLAYGHRNTPIARLDLIDSQVTNCNALYWGGGINASNCSLFVSKTLFENNSCLNEGGGGLVIQSYCEIDSSVFRMCSGNVGGLDCAACIGNVSNSLFEFNGIPNGRSTNHLFVGSSHITVSNCIFRNGLSFYPSISLISNPQIYFTGNLVEGLISHIVTGTIIFSSHGSISYNVFRNNRNIIGGAIYTFQGANGRIHHNYFQGNLADSSLNYGSVWLVGSNSHVFFDSNYVTGNEGSTINSFIDFPQSIDARNNWWGDASGPYHPTQNPQGLGDTLLSDTVLFIPWLTSPPDTTMPNAIDERERPEISTTWHLSEVYPNPFNSTVRLVIAGFTGREFRLTLHNLLGQEIAEIAKGPITGGQIVYNASASLASGVYFVRAVDKSFVQTKKIVFLK